MKFLIFFQILISLNSRNFICRRKFAARLERVRSRLVQRQRLHRQVGKEPKSSFNHSKINFSFSYALTRTGVETLIEELEEKCSERSTTTTTQITGSTTTTDQGTTTTTGGTTTTPVGGPTTTTTESSTTTTTVETTSTPNQGTTTTTDDETTGGTGTTPDPRFCFFGDSIDRFLCGLRDDVDNLIYEFLNQNYASEIESLRLENVGLRSEIQELKNRVDRLERLSILDEGFESLKEENWEMRSRLKELEKFVETLSSKL